MTTEPLPTIASLNAAVDVADTGTRRHNWESFSKVFTPAHTLYKSIVAHARTLDKLHGRTPIDPDLAEAREVCARVFERSGLPSAAAYYRNRAYGAERDRETQIALAAIKRGRELARGFEG